MSTPVDDQSRRVARARRAPAHETRDRIFEVACVAFSRAGFDQVGVREIAAAAGVDPAMVIRLCGSKEALFTSIAADAFGVEPAFEGPIEGLGARIAAYLTGPKAAAAPDELDELAFLMRSAASPTAGPILSAALHEGFVGPLAARFGGPDAQLRAALLTATILGFSTLRAALGSPALDRAARSRVAARLGAALQACVDPDVPAPKVARARRARV